MWPLFHLTAYSLSLRGVRAGPWTQKQWLLACSAYSIPGCGTPMVVINQGSALDLLTVNLREHLSHLGVTLPGDSSCVKMDRKLARTQNKNKSVLKGKKFSR